MLTDLLFDAAARRPTLLIIEDLHWVDPTSLELIRMTAMRIHGAAVLMVLSMRPEGAPPWVEHDRVTRLDLDRLSPAETEVMIHDLSRATPLPPELVRDLVEKSDGVPLYVEEVTRLVLEAGVADANGAGHDGNGAHRDRPLRSLADLGVPASLQESLIARLDRLGPSKDLAQLCAVVGRSFDFELIKAASGIDEAGLRKELDRLRDLDILHTIDGPSVETFVFKHALIQDAAYASLVRSRRRELHRHVGETLAAKFSARIETRPELLAHHWAEADRADAAIPCLVSAGHHAIERSAYVEAARHLKQGLALIEALPDSDARRARELELCLALGPVLVATRGYSNPEVERIYARARALCASSGDDRLLYAALSGLHLFHQSRAELATCIELGERRMEIARRLGDPALEMHVLETQGTVAFWRGEHDVALARAARGAGALRCPARARDPADVRHRLARGRRGLRGAGALVRRRRDRRPHQRARRRRSRARSRRRAQPGAGAGLLGDRALEPRRAGRSAAPGRRGGGAQHRAAPRAVAGLGAVRERSGAGAPRARRRRLRGAGPRQPGLRLGGRDRRRALFRGWSGRGVPARRPAARGPDRAHDDGHDAARRATTPATTPTWRACRASWCWPRTTTSPAPRLRSSTA